MDHAWNAVFRNSAAIRAKVIRDSLSETVENAMKNVCLTSVIALTSFSAAAVDVGVSVNIGQPGFYGQINLGTNMVPQLVLPQPVLIAPPPTGVVLAPLYLRVPIAYTHEWHKYCGQYNACGRQVYFVRDEWYEREYVPRYRKHPEEFREVRHDRRDERHDHEGHGKGRGRGHGKGHD